MDTPLASSPLTMDHYNAIRNALDVAAVAKVELDKAARAGVPVDGLADQLKAHVDKLNSIKNVYFPNLT